MRLYRIHSTISLGGGKYIPRGSISDLSMLRPSSIDRHLELRQITVVQPPPLDQLPGYWQERGKALRPHGIVTVTDFIEADDEVIAEYLEVKPTTVRRLKKELEEFIS